MNKYKLVLVALFISLQVTAHKVAYLLDCCPLATNVTAFIVMTISIIGVLQSVVNKRKIQCACLGAVFDLPMSTITIIEDALMILISGYMIWGLTF